MKVKGRLKNSSKLKVTGETQQQATADNPGLDALAVDMVGATDKT